MKIVDDRTQPIDIYFKDIKVGQYFLYDKVIYLKTNKDIYHYDVTNAFDLVQECEVSFEGYELIHPIIVELHIVDDNIEGNKIEHKEQKLSNVGKIVFKNGTTFLFDNTKVKETDFCIEKGL